MSDTAFDTAADTTVTDNPLLDFSGLPRFERSVRARGPGDAEARRVGPRDGRIHRRRYAPATWDVVAEPLAGALDRIDRAWGAVHHLNAVVSTAEWREAYQRRAAVGYCILYRPRAGPQALRALSRARRLAVVRHSRRGETQGRDQRIARLPARRRGAARAREGALKAIQAELALLAARFDDNLLDATNAWALYVTMCRVGWCAGERAGRSPRRRRGEGKPGWKLTLRMPCLPAGADPRR
jgi:oligopeptidase A